MAQQGPLGRSGCSVPADRLLDDADLAQRALPGHRGGLLHQPRLHKRPPPSPPLADLLCARPAGDRPKQRHLPGRRSERQVTHTTRAASVGGAGWAVLQLAGDLRGGRLHGRHRSAAGGVGQPLTQQPHHPAGLCSAPAGQHGVRLRGPGDAPRGQDRRGAQRRAAAHAPSTGTGAGQAQQLQRIHHRRGLGHQGLQPAGRAGQLRPQQQQLGRHVQSRYIPLTP